jgi:hypothetical protein
MCNFYSSIPSSKGFEFDPKGKYEGIDKPEYSGY